MEISESSIQNSKKQTNALLTCKVTRGHGIAGFTQAELINNPL